MELMSLNVSTQNVDKVIRSVLHNVASMDVESLPKQTTLIDMTSEMKGLACQKLAEQLTSTKKFTLHNDGRGGSRGVYREQVHPLLLPQPFPFGHGQSKYSNRAVSDNCDKTIKLHLGSVAMEIICSRRIAAVAVSYTCFLFFLVFNLF